MVIAIVHELDTVKHTDRSEICGTYELDVTIKQDAEDHTVVSDQVGELVCLKV